LADAGLKLVFTGHFHAQDIAGMIRSEGETSKFFDIETGSLVSFPCPYRIVSLQGSSSITIRSEFVTQIDFDTGDQPFSEYAESFLYEGISRSLLDTLSRPVDQGGFGLPEDLVVQIAPQICDAAIAHFAGDETPTEEIKSLINDYLNDYLESGDFMIYLIGLALSSLWTDLPPADNNVVLSISPIEIDIYTNKSSFFPGDTVEIGIKVVNPSEEIVDLYAALLLDGNYYWYPLWDMTPVPIKIDTNFWDENILTFAYTDTIPQGIYSFYAVVVEHNTDTLIGKDSISIEIN
jgi:hypothetical protein